MDMQDITTEKINTIASDNIQHALKVIEDKYEYYEKFQSFQDNQLYKDQRKSFEEYLSSMKKKTSQLITFLEKGDIEKFTTLYHDTYTKEYHDMVNLFLFLIQKYKHFKADALVNIS
jgi:hypothetical protein